VDSLQNSPQVKPAEWWYSMPVANRSPIVVGEWYHCYTRGVDKRIVFDNPEDFDRFLLYLYISNGTKNIKVSDLPDTKLLRTLNDKSIQRGEALVEIGAYSLMPNHVHLILREIREKGIATFMQKVFTGYTMYFNNKNARTGALFSGTFKSKHISDERYLKQVVPYVLLNPIELFEPKWKTGTVKLDHIEKNILAYEYSSLPDFFALQRPHQLIVGNSLHDYYDHSPSLSSMLRAAQEYYQEHTPQV
jgi:REP element-mobilizing transposase RayT